jgi:hypothetical protein
VTSCSFIALLAILIPFAGPNGSNPKDFVLHSVFMPNMIQFYTSASGFRAVEFSFPHALNSDVKLNTSSLF